MMNHAAVKQVVQTEPSLFRQRIPSFYPARPQGLSCVVQSRSAEGSVEGAQAVNGGCIGAFKLKAPAGLRGYVTHIPCTPRPSVR